jgi:hypothetical protein
MRMDLQEFSDLAHSLKLPEFLQRYGGFYLAKTDRPERFGTGAATEVRDFSREGAPLRPGCEIVRVCKREGSPDPDRISVGRAPQRDIVLRDASVSKLHAYLRICGDHVELIDHSRNGTRVNGVTVPPDSVVRVATDSVVHFGNIAAVLLTAASLYEVL